MGENSRRLLRRALRALGRAAAAGGIALTFAGATGVGLVLHVDTPAGRRASGELVAGALSRVFQGKIAIGSFERITLHGVTAKNVVVIDPSGNSVLTVSELRARADLLEILYEVLFETGDLKVRIPHVRVESAEGQLIPDAATGLPTIAVALTPIQRPAEPGGEPATVREITVELPLIEVGRAFARGQVAAGGPTFEAQTNGTRGGVFVKPRGVAIVVQRTPVRVRGVGGVDAVGTAELKAVLPHWIHVGFDGNFGELQVNATTLIRGDKVTLKLDLPRARPADVRALVSDWPLQQDVTVHVEANGVPPAFDTTARVSIGEAELDAKGEVRVAGPNPGANLTVVGRDIDLRSLWTNAPATAIDAESAVNIWGRNGEVVVDVNGTTQPTRIAGEDVPAVDVTGSFDRRGFHGKATLHEQGLPVKVAVEVHPGGAIDLDATARKFTIEKAPRLVKYTEARGQAEARVKAHIENERVNAEVTADVRNFSLGELKLGSGKLTGSAEGPIEDLRKLNVSARLSGNDLDAGRYKYRDVRAGARGPLRRPHVEVALEDRTEPKLKLSGYVTAGEQPRVDDLRVSVSRDGATLEGRAKRVELGGGSVEVSDLEIGGDAGELRGELRLRQRVLEARFDSEAFDLEKLSRILGLERGFASGTLSVTGEVSIGSDVQRGRVHVKLKDGTILSVPGVSLELVSSLEQYDLSGNAWVKVEDLADVREISWNTRLAGNVMRLDSWRDMIGETHIAGIRAQLSKLGALLEARFPELAKLGGVAYGDLRITRRLPAALPSVTLENAGVLGFELETKGANEKPGLQVRDIDLQLAGAISGETGDTMGTVRVLYEGGTLASAAANARLDLVRLIQKKNSFGDVLLDAPLVARAALGAGRELAGGQAQTFRRIADLPEWMRPTNISGALRAHLNVTGTLRTPSVSADLEAKQFLLLETPHLPVDLRLVVGYDVPTGRFGGRATAVSDGQTVASLTARGIARWQELLLPEPDKPSWTGSAELELNGLPLGAIPPLAAEYINGRLYKKVVLIRDDLAPQINGNVELREADLDGIPLGNGTLEVRANQAQLRARAFMSLGDGRFDATVLAGLAWDEITPRLDEQRPLKITLDATNYDAAVLKPLLKDVLSELRGQLSGHLEATLSKKPDPANEGQGRWTGPIEGNASMRDGVLQVAELGFELNNVSFTAKAEDAGQYTLIAVNNLVGYAGSKKSRLRANAKLYLSDLVVKTANVSADATDVPLLIEGVAQAYASSRLIEAQLVRHPEEMHVIVNLPQLEAKLPRSSDRSLIELDDNPAITVEESAALRTSVRSPTALPWRVEFRLDERNVVGRRRTANVRVLRHDLNLPLRGRPVMWIRDEVTLEGDVTLVNGGVIQLVGKPFRIESGRLTFDNKEDPDNPLVDVSASWSAQDGTILYVLLRGRWKEAEITLQSDPPRSDQEKWALILGGRPSEEEGEAASGSAAAGLIEATRLNDLLAGTALSSFEFSAGQTEEGTQAYTAGARISDTVWFEGTYRPQQEDNSPSESTTDFSGTVDWRFHPRWSLRTEVGTVGTGLDLLWQYRY